MHIRAVRCLPLLAALLLPAAVLGQQAPSTLGEERLRGAISVDAMLEGNAQLADGREIGELADLLIARDGSVREFLLALEDIDDSWNRDAVTFADDVADYGEAPLYEKESAEGELEADYVAVEAGDLRFDESAGTVSVRLGERSIGELPRRDRRESGSYSGVYASDIIGLEVRLEDEASWGEVEDILLREDGGEVLAYVVDHWEGLDMQRHALPAASAEFLRARRENAIREEYGIEALGFPYSAQQLRALPEYPREAAD